MAVGALGPFFFPMSFRPLRLGALERSRQEVLTLMPEGSCRVVTELHVLRSKLSRSQVGSDGGTKEEVRRGHRGSGRAFVVGR